jgi:predicted dehydrogenase
MHGPAAMAALARGVPALVEKPLCRTPEEAAALAGFARREGVLLAGVANKRFSPPYALARALIADGALKAAPTLFSAKFTLGYPYVDLLEGGTVHVLDLALWLMGPVGSVHAIGTKAADGRLEGAAVNLGFVSGAIGTVVTSANAMSFKPWERVEIIGRNAMLTVEDQYELSLFDDETGPAKIWRPVIPNTLLLDEEFGGYAPLLAHVLDAVRGLVPLGPTGGEAAAAVALVAAIHESIAGGHTVRPAHPIGTDPGTP